MEKWPQMAPNRAGRIFFLLIQTLPTFWAEWIWIVRILIFWIVGPQISGFPGPQISKFPDFQVPRFSDFPPPLTPPPDELSDPDLTPLPTHPGIKYVARALSATWML